MFLYSTLELLIFFNKGLTVLELFCFCLNKTLASADTELHRPVTSWSLVLLETDSILTQRVVCYWCLWTRGCWGHHVWVFEKHREPWTEWLPVLEAGSFRALRLWPLQLWYLSQSKGVSQFRNCKFQTLMLVPQSGLWILFGREAR